MFPSPRLIHYLVFDNKLNQNWKIQVRGLASVSSALQSSFRLFGVPVGAQGDVLCGYRVEYLDVEWAMHLFDLLYPVDLASPGNLDRATLGNRACPVSLVNLVDLVNLVNLVSLVSLVSLVNPSDL